MQAEGLGGGNQSQLGLRLLTLGRRVHGDVLGSRHRVNTAVFLERPVYMVV